MSTLQNLPLFHGGKADENPQNFLKRFEIATYSFKDPDKERCTLFANFLDSEGEGEKWHDGLDSLTRNDWTKLKAAFQKRWPKVQEVEKTKNDYFQEMEGDVLKMDDLATKVTEGGKEIWSHMAWANRQERRALAAQIYTSDEHIYVIRKLLPVDLRLSEKVPTSPASWAVFLKAIKDLDRVWIETRAEMWREEKEKKEKDEVERKKKEKELETRLKVLDEPPQMRELRKQLEHTSIAGPSSPSLPPRGRGYSRAFYPQQPFGRGSSPQSQPRASVNIEQLRRSIEGQTLFEKSDTGRAAYQAEVVKWVAQHGHGTWPTIDVPFPLSPGTVRANSRECWSCGLTGHQNRDCVGPEVDPREREWRRLVFFAFRSVAAAAVNYVGGWYGLDSNSFSAGNGEGSSM